MGNHVNQMISMFEVWLPAVLEYGFKLTLALLTSLIGWCLINKLTRQVSGLLELHDADCVLREFIGSLANITFKVLLLVSTATMVGVETTSFIAAISTAGLAVGLALQGSLANFAGGVLILLFRPFRVGDWIEAQGVSGSVDRIEIFHTTLKTTDNKVVIVPNGSLSNGNITNYSREEKRRVDINLDVDYSRDIKLVRLLLLEIASDPRVLTDTPPEMVVTGMSHCATNLSLRVWVATVTIGR